jgi:hypothetical protein
MSSMQDRNDTRSHAVGVSTSARGQSALSSAQPSESMQPPSTPDKSAQNRVYGRTMTLQWTPMDSRTNLNMINRSCIKEDLLLEQFFPEQQ